ncbi:MAG: FkbM family methyltransferase [Candidatus Binatus sp.]
MNGEHIAKAGDRSAGRLMLRRLLPRPLRNFMRGPGATARWLAQECEYRFGYAPECTVRQGWTVRCHPASCSAFEDVRAGEDYSAELDGFVSRCTDGMKLLDVGSHFGLFTLAALRFGGPTARVVAADPSAYANHVLRANLKLMSGLERVNVVEAAVGARVGELPMLTAGANGLHFLVPANSDRSDATLTKMTTVSELVSTLGCPFTHIKIDVEGHEQDVLAGGIDYIGRFKPLIFLELHGQILRDDGRDPVAITNLLADCGYHKYEWRGRAIDAQHAGEMDVARIVCLPD